MNQAKINTIIENMAQEYAQGLDAIASDQGLSLKKPEAKNLTKGFRIGARRFAAMLVKEGHLTLDV